MIIGQYRKLEIGSIHYGITDTQWNRHPNMPYKIIREATQEEWVQDAKEAGGTEEDIEYALRLAQGCGGGHYYEVSID
jgi:hypothetical protein